MSSVRKGEGMKEEIYGIAWGTGLLVLGLVILMFVFVNAYDIVQNPSEKFTEWAPDETQGPTAAFGWVSADTSVRFNDDSLEGDGKITDWHWEFGDGSASNEKNPVHDYGGFGDYTVSLEVTDENGNKDSVDTIVQVEEGSRDGHTEEGFPFDLGFGNMFKGMGTAVLMIGILAIMVMIGGRLIMAGAHLLRPLSKTLKVRVKPEDREVEALKKQEERL